MGKPKSQVSQELQDTVRNNEHITEVHFTKNGSHFFNVHKYDGGNPLYPKDTCKGLYGRIIVDKVLRDKKQIEISTPVISTKVMETCSREDILAANAEQVTDKKLISLDGLSEEQIKAITDIQTGKIPAKK